MLKQIQEYPLKSIPIVMLHFDSSNPNQLTREQMHGLRRSMERFGYLTPIVVDEDYNIADGEHRVLIYKEFGLTEIPAYVIPLKDDAERRLLRQTMNKLRGAHDEKLDAAEMAMLYQQDKLFDLSTLIAQKQDNIIEQIRKYEPAIFPNREESFDVEQAIQEVEQQPAITQTGDVYILGNHKLMHGDVTEQLRKLPDESVDCCITSPPYYGLRDYGIAGQLGLEDTPDEYALNLVKVFDEVKRILKPLGSCWVNLGDAYGSGRGEPGIGTTIEEGWKQRKPLQGLEKSMVMAPERFALEMLNHGWTLRNKIVWHKPNVMPSSAVDRFTVDWEYLYFFTKNKDYFFETQYDELTHSRKRCVWTVSTSGIKDAHFAVFPKGLIQIPIKATCPQEVCSKCGKPREKITQREYEVIQPNIEHHKLYKGNNFNARRLGMARITGEKVKGYNECGCGADFELGTLLDIFAGSGTSIIVAQELGRKAIGIELNPQYCDIAVKRWEAFTGRKAERVSTDH